MLCKVLKGNFSLRQGILGVYMREPLLDWQKEGRLLKDARTDSTQAADTAEDMHIAAKVLLLFCLTLQGLICLCGTVACRVNACALDRACAYLGCATLQVQTARDKLQGRHPSDILLAELAPKYSATPHWAALQVIG